MKKSQVATPAASLPTHHIAVLMEGPWLLTEDPDDPSRVLAVCPYTNATDHVCDLGVWNREEDSLGGFSANSKSGLVREGDQYWVDITGQTPKAEGSSVRSLLEPASVEYGFVYMQDRSHSGDPTSVGINLNDPLMRRVSISMPDMVIPLGKMITACVKPSGDGAARKEPGQYISDCGDKTDRNVFVTFAFIYKVSKNGAAAITSNCFVQASIPATPKAHPRGSNPHLVFRVHNATALGTDGCSRDISAENTHMISSFDSMRKLVTVFGNSETKHIDLGFYPTSDTPSFEPIPVGFTKAEVGIEKGGLLKIRTLASCQTGPVGAQGVD